LRELQRIAEQHDVARRRSHRERVGERHLPGLVDHERVDLAVERFVREQPCGSREQQDVGPASANSFVSLALSMKSPS
jgi:hypothetical protein